MNRWPPRYLFGALFLSVCPLCLATAGTQTPTPIATHHEDNSSDESGSYSDPAPYLSLNLNFDPAGKVKVSGMVYPQQLDAAAAMKSAIQEALGCQLTDVQLTGLAPGFYSGECTPISSRAALVHTGRISTAPLRTLLENHDISEFQLSFHFPEADLVETVPPAPDVAFAYKRMYASSVRSLARRSPSYVWSLHNSIPREIDYRFGFTSSSLNRVYVFLAIPLFAPLLLCFWLGRKALSAQTSDKAVVWFSYMRYLQWILNLSLLGWWAALDESRIRYILDFLAAGKYAAVWNHLVTYEILSWIPPAIVWLLCLHLSHPVQQKLRGLGWTRRELSLQSLYSLLIGLFPFAFFFTGLSLITAGQFRSALGCFVAAVVVRTLAAQALLKFTGMRPQALSTGPLRDRAFAMAEKLGVKLQQVFLIPSGRTDGQRLRAHRQHHLFHRFSPPAHVHPGSGLCYGPRAHSPEAPAPSETRLLLSRRLLPRHHHLRLCHSRPRGPSLLPLPHRFFRTHSIPVLPDAPL